MLGSFVIGSWQWEELLQEKAHLSAEAPLPIQVVLPSSDSWDGGHPQMEEAIARTEELLPQFEGRAETIVGSSPFAPCPRYVAFMPDEAFQQTLPLYLYSVRPIAQLAEYLPTCLKED